MDDCENNEIEELILELRESQIETIKSLRELTEVAYLYL